MKRRNKNDIVLYSVLSLVALIIALDFIPVKMAVDIKTDDLTKFKKNENQKVYICKHVQVTGSIWQVIGDEKGVRKLFDCGVIYLADPLLGSDPLRELNHAFRKIYEPQARNGFIFIGEEEKRLMKLGI